MPDLIGSDRLLRIFENLISIDVRVLMRLDQHRYLQTQQLARFEFADRPTSVASVRAAHRTLKRMRQLGLIAMLERAVGGPKRGSTAAIWTLTNTGIRIVELASGTLHARRRIVEPTLTFLRHEVAVVELHLALLEAAVAPVVMSQIELEPDCWRRYLGSTGAIATLKPDAAVRIDSRDFESHYFFEVDRATETPHRIVAKCLQYQEYYRSGTEAKRSGVLPIVIWVEPDDTRREQLFRHLTAENLVDVRLFRVLLLDEVGRLVNEDETVGLLPVSNSVDGTNS